MADYHVTHDKSVDAWKVSKVGGEKASAVAATQASAVKRAGELARKSGGGEVNIHRKSDNAIRDKNTVGKRDPFPPKG